jgi:hypothetical protein
MNWESLCWHIKTAENTIVKLQKITKYDICSHVAYPVRTEIVFKQRHRDKQVRILNP